MPHNRGIVQSKNETPHPSVRDKTASLRRKIYFFTTGAKDAKASGAMTALWRNEAHDLSPLQPEATWQEAPLADWKRGLLWGRAEEM